MFRQIQRTYKSLEGVQLTTESVNYEIVCYAQVTVVSYVRAVICHYVNIEDTNFVFYIFYVYL